MATSLISLLTGRCVRDDVALTGEISLRGMVMPVGGIKEKALAAHRAGIKRVVMPDKNRKDMVDIPKEIREDIEIIFVKSVEQVIDLVLKPPPRTIRKRVKGAASSGDHPACSF